MKLKYILYLLGILAVACNQKNNDSGTSSIKVTDSIEVAEQSVTPTSVLFGSNILATFSFPLEWGVRDNATKEDDTINKKYVKAYHFYSLLVKHKTIPKPEINNIEYLSLGSSHPSCVDSTNKIIDSIRYKLPNIGPYECYYSQDRGAEGTPEDSLTYEEVIDCAYTGNLLFYSRESKKAKVINVFFKASSHLSSDVRLFYLDNKNTIYTFRVQGDETDMKLRKEYVIQVNENGQIEIVKDDQFK